MVPLQSFASDLRLGFLYPPIQVSTATIQGCLYPCDACTLRAAHILSHSPQPAGLTLAGGCTRDDFSLPRSLVFSLLARLRQLAVSCVRNLLFIPGCKAPHPQSPVVGRLRQPSPQVSLPPGVSQGFWFSQGLHIRIMTIPNAEPMLFCRKRCVS